MTEEYSIALQQAKKDNIISAQLVSGQAKRAEHFAEGLWAFDIQNNLVYWSDSLFNMLGMPRQASPLSMESVIALIHPEDQTSFEKVIQTSLDNHDAFLTEFRINHKIRAYLTVQLSGNVYLDEQGRVSRISGQMSQITKLQQTEIALKKANKDLADLRYALDESMVLSITDRHGVITYINDALCRISQYSQEELIGETLQIINSGYHSPLFFKQMWDQVSSSQIWRGEIKNQAKDGSFFWMDTTIVPLLDSRREPFQYVVVRHDITRQKDFEQKVLELRDDVEEQREQRTAALESLNLAQGEEIKEQKEIESKLKKSLKREKLTKHLIQLMNRSFDPDIILEIIVQELGTFFDVDRCLVILYQNENEDIKARRIFAQYCRSETIYPPLQDELPWEEWRNLPKKVPSVMILTSLESGNSPVEMIAYLENNQIQSAIAIEIKYRGIAFGRLLLHQCSYLRIWTEQDIDFMEILAIHIGAALYQAMIYQREKQSTAKAEEANRQKSKVLSFVSHDFKNPLSSINWFIDTLENDKNDILSKKHRELIGCISEGVGQLRNMVMDILDKARLSEGKITPVPQVLEVSAFIEALKPTFNSMTSPRNVTLNIDIQPKLLTIKTDPTHLRQILINLVSNAVKYNRPNGQIFLSLSQPANRQCFILKVQDTGLGIPHEKMPQLFKEYFRTNFSQINPVEGTGLGLAFIKKLIELSGGSISVESELEIGSTFTVELPVKG